MEQSRMYTMNYLKQRDVIPRMEHTLIFCLLVLISILQVLIKNIQVQQENFSL